MSNTSLPPELEDVIIQHLSGDTRTLQRCALVSRTWSAFSQDILFRNLQVKLYSYEKTAKLLADLIFAPHLQTLVRDLAIYRRLSDDDIPLSAHLSCLASVLSRLPNLEKVAFEGGDLREESIQSYLDLIPDVLGNAPLVEMDSDIYSFESFQDVFEILEGTQVKRITLSGIASRHPVRLVSPREHLHLPSLECIRFGVEGLQRDFHRCLTHKLDLPNLKQCEIFTNFVHEFLRWRSVLLRGFPPLWLFKLELESGT